MEKIPQYLLQDKERCARRFDVLGDSEFMAGGKRQAGLLEYKAVFTAVLEIFAEAGSKIVGRHVVRQELQKRQIDLPEHYIKLLLSKMKKQILSRWVRLGKEQG